MAGLQKRSLRLAGHATSVALEPEYWAALEELATVQGKSLMALVGEIDTGRTRPLASEIRVFVLQHTQRQ